MWLQYTTETCKDVKSYELKDKMATAKRCISTIKYKLGLIDSSGQQVFKVSGIVGRHFDEALKSMRVVEKYIKMPTVSSSVSKLLEDTVELLEDISESFIYEEGEKYREIDLDTGTVCNLDIPYKNRFVVEFVKLIKNKRIDAITRKTLINNAKSLAWLESVLYKQTSVAVDLETTGLDPRTEKLVGISMSWYNPQSADKNIYAVYMACGHIREDSLFAPALEEQLTQAQVLEVIQKLVDADIEIIVHNAAFDIKWLIQLGIKFKKTTKIQDTMLMVKCFDERVKAGLKESSLREFRYVMTKFEEVTGTVKVKGKKVKKTFDTVPLSQALAYAGTDAVMTRLLSNWYKKQLESVGTWEVYWEFEMPCVIPIAEMELNGCRVDANHFEKMGAKLNLHLHKLRAEIITITGLANDAVEDLMEDIDEADEDYERVAKDLGKEDPDYEFVRNINLASSQQVSELLYKRMDIQAKKYTKKNAPSTGTKALALIKKEHPIIGKILEFRVAKKILDAYIKPLDKFINPITGKIHTQIRQYGARSGRMSMSSPSLQVLPRSDEWDIRAGFIAGPGNVIIESDFCQMELMQVGSESQDPVMMEAFKAHRQMIELMLAGVDHKDPTVLALKLKADLHIKAAAGALKKNESEVTDKERTDIGKVLNFLIVYGGTKTGLAEILTSRGRVTTEEQAQELIDGYFSIFKGLKVWLDKQHRLAGEKGKVRHACGRLVHNPKQFESISEAGIRTLVNSLIQGQCAAMFKKALARVYWRLKEELGNPSVQIINVVHDAIYICCPQDTILIQKVLNIVREGMEYTYKTVHFSVEQSIKKSMSKKDKVKIPELVYA